jgi:hypothetical protein
MIRDLLPRNYGIASDKAKWFWELGVGFLKTEKPETYHLMFSVAGIS